jgi:hypothetical protein
MDAAGVGIPWEEDCTPGIDQGYLEKQESTVPL